MIYVLSLPSIIVSIAACYAILIVIWTSGIQYVTGDSWSVWKAVTTAVSGAALLQLFLIFCVDRGWRELWKCVPRLNELVYPDIEGEWNISIEWRRLERDERSRVRWIEESGTVNAKARIRQSLLKMSMEVESSSSDSQTLMAQPKRDPASGTSYLYYTYLVTPKEGEGNAKSPYYGAAILKIGEGKLEGNYWTSGRTVGRYSLFR